MKCPFKKIITLTKEVNPTNHFEIEETSESFGECDRTTCIAWYATASTREGNCRLMSRDIPYISI